MAGGPDRGSTWRAVRGLRQGPPCAGGRSLGDAAFTTDRHRGPASASDAHLVGGASAGVGGQTHGTARFVETTDVGQGGAGSSQGRPGHGARSGRYHVAGSAMSQRAADTGRTTHPAERADRRGPVRGRLFLSDRAAATGRRTRRCHHQRCRAGHVRRGVTCVPDQPGSVTGCAADSDGAGFAARYRSYRRVRPGSRQQDRYVDVFAGDAPGQSGRTAVGDTGKYARRQSRDRRPKPKTRRWL